MKRHPALWLTLGLALFYTLLGNGRIDSGDGEAMFQVTKALAEQGRLDLPPGILPPVETILVPSTDSKIPYTLVGYDGRTYAKYGLGQSLVALPLYGLGMAWRTVTGNNHAPRFAASLLNGLLTAATAGLVLVLVRELAFPIRTAVLIALTFALCTPAWPYTHTYFSEPLVTFLLTAAGLSAIRCTRRNQIRWLALPGAALGLALSTRISAVAALPAFALYLALTWRAQRPPIHLISRQAALGLIAFGAGATLILAYNLLRFADPFDFGYRTSNWQTPFLAGLYGLSLSPGKGLLWYAPPVFLGLFGLPAFARRVPREAFLCAGVVAGYLLLHSTYTYWEGGWCWGPRLILPALPFALLPAASLLSQPVQRPLTELALALVLVLGLLVQIPAVGSNYAHPLQRAYASSPQEFQGQVLYQPEHSPIIRQWLSLLEVASNLRNPLARSQIADLLATARPKENALLLTDSFTEALRLERQSILAYNLPDLWLITSPWLGEGGSP